MYVHIDDKGVNVNIHICICMRMSFVPSPESFDSPPPKPSSLYEVGPPGSGTAQLCRLVCAACINALPSHLQMHS